MHTNIKIHISVNPFACPDCDKKLKQTMYCWIHAGEKSFICPDCDKKFQQCGQRISYVSSNLPLGKAVVYMFWLQDSIVMIWQMP